MKLCVALDLPSVEENVRLAQKLIGKDLALKVGLNTFIAGGPDVVRTLKQWGFEVCLDLKLYDIPNTMAEAAKRISQLEVDMFTIHASAGRSGMEAVAAAIDTCYFQPKILAVTVLTSFSNDECYEIYEGDVSDKAEYFAVQSRRAGMDGIVCSVHEGPFLRPYVGPDMILFMPGIRLEDSVDDQARKGGIKVAYVAGADYAVIGRPIYNAENPVAKVDEILEKICETNNELYRGT